MKPYVFLVLSVFILKSSIAQFSGSEKLVLNIEKKRYNQPGNVSLQFKPQSILTIKTSDGKRLKSENYIYKDSSIVMHTSTEYGKEFIDTIPFQDIVKIRGKVFGNADRKIAGGILTLGGLPVAAMGYVVATLSSSPTGAIFMMLPGVGLSASGISLMGARSFYLSDKWTLKTTPSDSQSHQP